MTVGHDPHKVLALHQLRAPPGLPANQVAGSLRTSTRPRSEGLT
jgi:hypothetical protein